MSSQGISGKSVGWSITWRPRRNRGIQSKGNDEDPESPSSDGRARYSRGERMGSCRSQADDGEGGVGKCPE